MPVSFNSPARNLFLLGSSGGTVVTNFFKTILDSSTDGVFSTKEISYNYSEQNYILSGSGSNNNSVGFGWLEKRDYDAETDPDNPTSTVSFANKIQSTTSSNLILNDIELDSNNNIIACGITGSTPWIAKYSNAGVLDWNSTSNSGEVEYKNITSDSNGEYYASGNTTTSNSNAFIEKFDSSGNPTWGKSATILGRDIELNGIAVNDRSEVVSVGWLEDDSRTKAYLVKVDTANGSVLWDKTFSSSEISGLIYTSTLGEDVFIDSEDNIYMVGKLYNSNDSSTKSFIIKLSPEGNIIWQKETDENIEYYRVKADGDTGQVVTFGRYYDSVENDQGGLITKYTRGGDISWRRSIFSSYNGSDFFGSDTINGGGIGLDADASFYYVLYTDDERDALNGTPTSYTFGKVSTSGNGLGGFEYDDGESETVYYDILNSTERIGRLSDGSVRNDTSDLITYPFNATRIAFDDYATPVSNKKRQMDGPDSFEYSGSPAIRPVDFLTKEYDTDGYGVPPQKNYIGLAEALQPTSTSTTGTTNNTWSRQSTNTTVTANVIASPIGVGSMAEKYNLSATNGRRLEYGVPSGVFVAGQQYTYSWWMKAITTNAEWNFQAYSAGNSNNSIRIADKDGNILENISTTDSVTYIPKDTEWHRVVWSFTANNTTGSPVGGYNGNAQTGDLWYLWGAQLVDGPDPLKYYRNYTSTPENAAGTEHAPSITAGATYSFDQTETLQIGEIPGDFSQMTVEIWFKSSTFSNWQNPIDCNYSTQDVDGNGAANSGNVGPRLEINASGQIGWYWGSSLAANDPKSSSVITTISTNTWYHSVFSISGAGMGDAEFFLNGSSVGVNNNAGGGSWIGIIRNLVLGRGFVLGGRTFNGEIGEVRIYPRALTAAQVFQNYNATKSKYINEAPDTTPKISDSAIVYDSNLLLNYDFGNRATYDDTQNHLIDKFAADNDTGEYYTDEQGVKHKIYEANTNLNSAYGGTSFFDAGTYDVSVSMWMKATDIQTNRFALLDGLGAPVTSTYSFIPKIANPDGGIVSHTWTNVTISDNWNFVLSNSNGDARTMQYARPHLTLKPSLGRYVKAYESAITAPTTVKNLSSSSFPGTINGATFNSAGYFEFDGTNDYIQSSSVMSPGSADFSVIMWYKITSTSGRGGLFERATSSPYSGWVLGQGGSLDWSAAVRDASNNNAAFQYTFPTVGEWTCDAFTWDVSTQTLTPYRNGANAGTATNSGTVGSLDGNSRSPMAIGARLDSASPQYKPMECGEVQMYTRVLTATEVSQNFNATRGKYGV
ncbi:virion structural protein [Cyanophage S-RIM44]|uniref:LamG-like jellyroll fold domain-containing protein n=1 Tax=Cyanophage S-RIM44 TaxID=1278485 RepID=A0A1D7SFD9_9CAUD|nr:virion structural protein [Cyanophage S-RIM44]AOO12395.1 hypothetical protein Np420711_217 [Cyanophage S-RIM44]